MTFDAKDAMDAIDLPPHTISTTRGAESVPGSVFTRTAGWLKHWVGHAFIALIPPASHSVELQAGIKRSMKVKTEERWSVDDMWKLRLGVELK